MKAQRMVLGFLVMAMGLAALASCANAVMDSSSALAGKASVRSLTLALKAGGASARTILPTTYPAPTSYDIVLHPAVGNDVARSVSATTCAFDDLAPIVYAVTVSGKDGDGNVVVSGTGSADMTAAQPVSSVINLNYISSGAGTGQMHLTFDCSLAALAVGSATMTLVDPLGTVTSGIALTGSTPTFSYANPAALAGSWKMMVTFVSGTKSATRLDTILVLQSIDTAATVTLAALDFSDIYVAVTSLALNESTMVLAVGGTTGGLAATVSPANASNSLVTWTSNAPGVADVDQTGLVTPMSAGTATITATSVDNPEATASCAVTVPGTYDVTYSSNGATSGSAPAAQTKIQGASLALAANSGNMALTGCNFGGWTTAADGSGTSYEAGATYSTDAALALFAKWTAISSSITTLASDLNPANFGSSVTFTATVVPATATGTVTFKDGGTTLGTGTLSGGVATFSTSGLGVGSHGITAEYSGDGGCHSSVSVAFAQTVGSTAAKDGDWNDPTTWSCGAVPMAGTNVTIGVGLTVVLNCATATLGNLTILGTLTVSGTQTITLVGNFIVNGTFNCGTGHVVLVGGSDTIMSASAPGALDFYYLTVNKDTTTTRVTATSKLRVLKKLTLTRGKLLSV